MERSQLDLAFEEIVEADVPVLTPVMTRAFDDDAQKHLGIERGGPPGYDNGDFFREWLFGHELTEGFKVLLAGQIIGGIMIWNRPDGHKALGVIFVDPAFQDRGVGTLTWQFIERQYPETKSWRLTTPCWATKNHHFYEKCGFRRVDSDPIVGAPEGEFVYRKEMI
jgi:GNAT superfamily N-acetyltransferase